MQVVHAASAGCSGCQCRLFRLPMQVVQATNAGCSGYQCRLFRLPMQVVQATNAGCSGSRTACLPPPLTDRTVHTLHKSF